jgi:hypothetical protein
MLEKKGRLVVPYGSGSSDDFGPEVDAFIKRLRRFDKEKRRIREYGTVVIWHRWIDENLTKAIKSRLKPIKAPLTRLFRHPGGLATFSARSHLGSLLGLYGAVTYGDLRTINDIRNDFAHAKDDPEGSGGIEILGFDHPEISKMCLSLGFIDATFLKTRLDVSSMKPKDAYCTTAEAIAIGLGSFVYPTPNLRLLRKDDDSLP